MTLVEDLKAEAKASNVWQHGKLYIMVGGVVCLSLLMVLVAMGIYNSSGAKQLDLSLDGYASVQKKVLDEHDITSFPANGTFDAAAFTDFMKQYDARVNGINAVNGYDPSAVANDSFNLAPAGQ